MKNLQQIFEEARKVEIDAEIEKYKKETFDLVLKFVSIEFSKFRDLYEILQEVKEEEIVIRRSIINLFLSECERKLPQFYYLEKEKDNELAIEIHQFLEGMGSKCYSAINGFCVDTSMSINLDCLNCFFRQICQAKTKKA